MLIVKEKKTDQPLVKSKWCVEKGLRRRFQWTGEFVVSSLIIRMIMRCTVGKAYGRQVWIADCGWWMVEGGLWVPFVLDWVLHRRTGSRNLLVYEYNDGDSGRKCVDVRTTGKTANLTWLEEGLMLSVRCNM